ncbi:hypothetical protein GCM10020367_07390 [Streptomyces sannanensis]|uniref:Serine/threonine protein kinase n=1 Tax=Streptomyces sannanensis TaxID=285536 RepID=A0ABP6S5X7_9ACTN
MTGEYTTSTGPPDGSHQQPRWAWWVVGIVIPLVGILVTVLVSRSGSSGDTNDKSVEPAPTRSTAATGSDAPEQPTETAGTVRAVFGPKAVAADTTNRGSSVDLDTTEPTVTGSDIAGADVTFGAPTGSVELSVPGYAENLAPLPASGAAPTATQCAESVRTNGTYTTEVKPGDRFCLLTGEGRTAYLRVLTAPVQGTGRLEITVWDTPAA